MCPLTSRPPFRVTVKPSLLQSKPQRGQRCSWDAGRGGPCALWELEGGGRVLTCGREGFPRPQGAGPHRPCGSDFLCLLLVLQMTAAARLTYLPWGSKRWWS